MNAGADANDPALEVPEVEPEFGLQPVDAEVSSPEDFIEPTAVDQEPSLNLESIMAPLPRFGCVWRNSTLRYLKASRGCNCHKSPAKGSRTM